MSLSTFSASFVAFALGVSSHLLIFVHGELDQDARLILLIFVAGYAFLILIETYFEQSVASGIVAASLLFESFQFGLCGSIAVYRLMFHRTCSFAGPSLDAISKWTACFRAQANNQYHHELAKLHGKHGDFVRIGT